MSDQKPTLESAAPATQHHEAETEAQPAATGKPQPGAMAWWSPRDLLVPYILLAVSLQRAHGYLIEEYLKSLGFWSVEMSTLYRTLRQLEKEGLLLSTWEPGPTGPARRVYSLTDTGRLWLEHWTSTLGMYRNMIDQFFDLYTGGKSSPEQAVFTTQPPEEGDQPR